MATFTPGPWAVEWRVWTDEHGDPKIAADVRAGQYSTIAGIMPIKDEYIANAKLIAAAPDLLQCLKDLVDACWDGRLEAEGIETFTEPARRAIAKAESYGAIEVSPDKATALAVAWVKAGL